MWASRFLSVKPAAIVALLALGLMFAIEANTRTPVGSVVVKLTAAESGAALKATVYLNSKQNGSMSFEKRAGTDGIARFDRVPAGRYTLSFYSLYHSAKETTIDIKEAETGNIEAELQPNDPSMEMFVHQHIFTPREMSQITCRGFIRSDQVGIDLLRVNLEDFLLKYGGSPSRLLNASSYGYGSITDAQIAANPSVKVVKSFDVTGLKKDGDGVFTQRIDIPELSPGLYLVRAKADGTNAFGWIMISRIGLVAKNAHDQTVAFAVDLKTGVPVSGAQVEMYQGETMLAQGPSGADGVAVLPVDGAPGQGGERTIIARYGDSVAFVSAWADSYEASTRVVYSYTDRPVYRPGHKVRYRGIVRSVVGEGYATPVGEAVTVEVRDSNDTLIYRTTATTDRFGCYHGELNLNSEAATGEYSLVTQTAGGKGSSSSFTVAAYKKPEFTAKIDFAKKRYVQGDRIRAKISANYYFGSPVVNAKVHYYVRRSPYYFFMEDEEDAESDDGYSDYGGYGEIIAEGDAVTDDSGEAAVSFRADWPKSRDRFDWGSDQSFGVEIEVMDQADRSVSKDSSVVATQGQYALRLTPSRYVTAPNETVEVAVETIGYNHKPAAGREVELSIGSYNWQAQEGDEDFITYQTSKVTTDRDGKAVISFAPKRSGDIVVLAKSRDEKGNLIKQETWIWSYSENFGQEDDGYRFPKLKIITDKKTYSAGETAKVVINSDVTGPTALVTVEGTRIYDRYTVKLDKKSTSIDIPVRSNYKPNFYISVCYVSKKRMQSQTVAARVSIAQETLSVSIEPSRKKLEPGEKISYLIKCTDNTGKPAKAQLSMGVVDEAIYAIAEDSTPKMTGFFYAKRYNAVSTAFSFPEIYLSDPDKAGMSKVDREPRVRRRFEDTAFWSPTVETNASGEASVSFDLPDNLTTWRTTVRAITAGTVCGEAKNNVVVSKKLLVRLVTPRFLVQGDKTTVSAIVHNYSGRGQNVEVSIDAPGLTLGGETTREVYVSDGADTRVDWSATPKKPGEVSIKVVAKGKTASDAIEMPLPVNPRGVPRDSSEVGALAGGDKTALSRFSIRDDAVMDATKTTIRIAPSLASAMLGSLDYLASYPYGCTEQTTSSFLPDVILGKALKTLGMRNPDIERSLPDMVATGLSRLYRFQSYNGGWGWCEYGNEDPWMTAYVCYALIQARNAGYVVNDNILGKGLYRMQELVKSRKTSIDDKVYCYYVMALSGKDVSASLRSIRYQKVKPASLAYASMAFGALGSVEEQKILLQALYQKSTASNGIINWGGTSETTAVALQATLKANPTDPRAVKIVRYLMDSRRDNYWYSTRETAMVLYAMTEYLAVTSELKPNYEAVVRINGTVVARQRIGPESVFAPEILINAPMDKLQRGSNTIEISRNGSGALYWSVAARQFISKRKMPAVVTGSGISISREYYNPGPRYFSGEANAKLGPQVTSCNVGDVVLVRVVVNAQVSLSRLLVEDYIPAGCEIIDQGVIDRWDWDYWWVDKDVRDDRISFFIDHLGRGRHVLDYQMRAGIAGIYTAMPAQVYAMYDPDVRASTEGLEFEIR